jgi:flagellar biosynthesis/type III secretory pathway protein FliH
MIILRQNREENEYTRGYKDGYLEGLKKSLEAGVKASPENAAPMLKEYEKAKELLFSDKTDKTDTLLDFGTAGALGAGTSSAYFLTPGARIKLRDKFKKGYIEGATKVLKEDLNKYAPQAKDEETLDKILDYYNKEKKSIPSRAKEASRKFDKQAVKKNKKILIGSGLTAAGLAGIKLYRKNKKKDK